MRLRPSPLLIAILAASALLPASLSSQDVEPEPRPVSRADVIAREVEALSAEYKSVHEAVEASRRWLESLPGHVAPVGDDEVAPAPDGDEEREDGVLPKPAEITLSINGPTEIPVGGYFILSVRGPVAGGDVRPEDILFAVTPTVPDGAMPPLELMSKTPGELIYLYQQALPGEYVFEASAQISVDRSAGPDPHKHLRHVVKVGKAKPDPDKDDDDADPEPEPEPDDKAPFPADGLHVLIVYESSQMNGLTADQREIIQGATTRAALNAAAPDRYRIYDKDADLTHVPQVWKDAMAVPRQSLPWLAISNGKAGYSGPLDMTAAEFRDLLTEFK